MTTLTKAEIIKILQEECMVSGLVSRRLVDEFFEALFTSLASGKSVKLAGFGRLTVRTKNARPGRNPKTGQPVVVTKRNVVVFKLGQKLKLQMNDDAKISAH